MDLSFKSLHAFKASIKIVSLASDIAFFVKVFEIVESSVDVPEITTNLADGSFVRLSLKIQGSDKKAGEELLKRDFQVKNIVIQELSEMEAEALEGKQGKVTFQNAIKSQMNELMQNGEVTQVYITSYVLQ